MRKLEVLDVTHDRTGFDCGVEALNYYLRNIARQHITKGISKTFVLAEEPTERPKRIFGFFTISLCQVFGEQLPPQWAKELPDEIPAMKLGRLAIAKDQQGLGFGKALLVEAVRRVALVADLAGGIGLFVDAKDEATAAFYVKFGFEPTQASALSLYLPSGTVRKIAS